MTTTDTMDTEATVAQSVRIIEAGGDYVRITAPSLNEAENLRNIRKELRSRGYTTPLIADIHYTPRAAEAAARIVEKVRINPGNYTDRRRQGVTEYTDREYGAELDRIRARLAPLVRICLEHGTAMRIGTNHGSLSDRIMSRFGDTPLGMVESALEFLRICEDLGYRNVVLSMKASNPQVMVQAYRLLVHRMAAEGMNYPLHLGVTEAGEGEDGRVRSAVGIGTLLEDGLGDTVRVSLTEEPEVEIPVALSLVGRYADRSGHPPIPGVVRSPVDPFAYARRGARAVAGIGGANAPVVIAGHSTESGVSQFGDIGYARDLASGEWRAGDAAADYVCFGRGTPPDGLPAGLGQIIDYSSWVSLGKPPDIAPLMHLGLLADADRAERAPLFVVATPDDLSAESLDLIGQHASAVLVLRTDNPHAMADIRQGFTRLMDGGVSVPVVIKREYPGRSEDEALLQASTDLGGLLTDGLGDGVWVEAPGARPGFATRAAFAVLQATRMRITRTEYISCPSCGRTLFDLQQTTAHVRERTDHLKGVKIAVMGCIVNGPGEMADADYGYVGSGPGKVTLYRGKEVVQRSIPSGEAVDELIGLIRADGRWTEREAET